MKRAALALLLAGLCSGGAQAELTLVPLSPASNRLLQPPPAEAAPEATRPQPDIAEAPQPGDVQDAPTPPADTPTAEADAQPEPEAPEPLVQPVPPPIAAPPPPALPPDVTAGSLLGASVGITAGSLAGSPTMMGDLFGGGVSLISPSDSMPFSITGEGFLLSGTSPADFQWGFAVDGGAPVDLFSEVGTGFDTTGDGHFDSYAILEPVPPTNAPTAPGDGFTFDGGTASTTTEPDGTINDGQTWTINYSYSSLGFNGSLDPIVLAGPDVATRRVKLSENFSPEIRDRVFFNYNFFNNAYGGLGDVSRYILGLERVIYRDLISLEARLPMAGTLASRQIFERPGDRDFELGNATLVAKAALWRTQRMTWTGGMGFTLPLADDARLVQGNQTILRIQNRGSRLLPFTGVVYRANERLFLQSYTQLDIDPHGNPVSANLAGGPLRRIGRFRDGTLMYIDVSAHRVMYQNRRAAVLRGVIANAELHYTTTLEGSDRVEGEGLTVTNLKRHFDVLNATFGTHLLVGDRMAVSPGVAVPLRGGLDRQFDIEGILQLNYLF